jgi:hypothetical protein
MPEARRYMAHENCVQSDKIDRLGWARTRGRRRDDNGEPIAAVRRRGIQFDPVRFDATDDLEEFGRMSWLYDVCLGS